MATFVKIKCIVCDVLKTIFTERVYAKKCFRFYVPLRSLYFMKKKTSTYKIFKYRLVVCDHFMYTENILYAQAGFFFLSIIYIEAGLVFESQQMISRCEY